MTTNNPFFKKREAIARNLPTRPHTPETGTTNSPTHRSETDNSSYNTAPDAAIKRKEVFNALVNDYDDEEEALLRAKQQNSLNRIASQSEIDSPILGKIEAKVKELQKKYPTGGIKTSRYITADILIEAPANFFDMYERTIEDGANYVRQELGDSNQSSKIAEAEQNPTDDFYQDEAYYIVQGIVSDYMSRSMWRDTHRKIISAMILNEILGFGRLEPLWRDRRIDEIICNGPHDIQVEISGELVKVPGCQFRDPAHLMRLIDKLYGSIGKTVTPLTPLVKGRLHDKSRMFAVHQNVAPDGPNISIRRHPEGFWTPEELVKFGSAPPELMTDLGNLIYKGASFMVAGGTHSGKTSLLNALTGFYKPKVRILTLEDNLEMKPNPKKYLAQPMECKTATSDSDNGVSMRDLVKAALQLRPDVIIVGEVTDDAAFDLAQALNTGHAGASTTHANTAAATIPRVSSLIAQGGLATIEGSLDMIAAAFDFIVVTQHFPVDGSRRIVAIEEVGTTPVNIEGRLTLETKPLWKFFEQGLDENGKIVGEWRKLGDLSKTRMDQKNLNINKDLTWEELKELSSIPEGYAIHSKQED